MLNIILIAVFLVLTIDRNSSTLPKYGAISGSFFLLANFFIHVAAWKLASERSCKKTNNELGRLFTENRKPT